VVQSGEPFALAGVWPQSAAEVDAQICSWADGVVIGPGLGHTSATRQLVDRVLALFGGPVVLDADALNVFDGDLAALRAGVGDRQALLTPHAAEFARLMGSTVEQVLTNRFDGGADLARRTGATVLLKGVPTTVTSPDGHTLVSASGTPVLAAAGSGDLLSGIAGTLLTQLDDALVAGATAAWIHGHAGELAARTVIAPHSHGLLGGMTSVPTQIVAGSSGRPRVRGVTLDDVLAALPLGWPGHDEPLPRYPVLLELPAVGERA
jgi:NAD(P)H-hydrate epimerase